MTDDSGGRTEMIYQRRDLDPATAGIASELSQQYFSTVLRSEGRQVHHEVRLKKVRISSARDAAFISS